MKKSLIACVLLAFLFPMMGGECDTDGKQDSDAKQCAQQEVLLAEATAQTGMPAIKNFRERKIMKDILELRDQNGLITYTYLFCPMTGKLVFLAPTVGYGIPYATQYTNPQKELHYYGQYGGGNVVLPQADPNGMFSPASAEGTWILIYDESGGKTLPAYIEERIIVWPFKIPDGDPRLARQ